mmetsp:Transcript_58785/g.119681  ORF Transcript_58785/g.119681 Transcript_58785/m.119681 type:complete len:84 (+) Transcript_58785:843-1094(+)
MDPSRFAGRGKKGSAADRSVLSTIESHIRSGISALKAEVLWLEELGANAMAEEAMSAETATVKDFMVNRLYVLDCLRQIRREP